MITTQKGRYQVLEPIGSGATSRVDKARDNVIGRTVALKTFIYAFGEDLEQQFLREARIVGQLSHPSVVQLYDVGIDERAAPYLVMEYIAGETLQRHLASSALTVPRACAWAVDLAGALATAHRAGIVHGDVKPGNIFITQENRVRLGDFGIARLTTQLSITGRVVGTPAYLAPEQIESELQDYRSDQFSFGVVFYQMLTGIRPFDGNSVGAVCAQILNDEPVPPSRHNPAVPPALDRVVARCLEKNPQDRFASCEDLAKSLYPFTRSRPRNSAPAIKKHSWWSAPVGPREVWMTVSACLLLALFVQIPRFLSARYGIPPAPTRQFFHPGVPYEALPIRGKPLPRLPRQTPPMNSSHESKINILRHASFVWRKQRSPN
jgi:serine/threonine protein kinase